MKYCPKCARELVTKEIEHRTRLACPDPQCGYVFWDNPLRFYPRLKARIEKGETKLRAAS